MQTRRFHCDALSTGPVPDGAVPEREARHLHKVLRASDGTRVLLMDGEGSIGEAVVGPGRSLVVEKIVRFPRPVVRIHLVVAPPSSKSALDHMLRQCSEVGVWSVDLTRSERSVAKPSGKGAFERMRLHLIEGCKQSGNPWFPRLGREPLEFSAAVEKAVSMERAFFGATRMESADSADSAMFPEEGADVAWMVGPEGGFSPEEERRMLDAGIEPLSIGPWTLRVETAAVVGAHVLSRGSRPARG